MLIIKNLKRMTKWLFGPVDNPIRRLYYKYIHVTVKIRNFICTGESYENLAVKKDVTLDVVEIPRPTCGENKVQVKI